MTDPITLLFWLLPLAAALHLVEEFAVPGGFPSWYRAYRPRRAASMTARFFVVINALLVIGVIAPLIDGPTPYGVALWLTFAAIVAGNGVFHLAATVRGRRYSPGLVTGLLYVPLAIVGFASILRAGLASVGTAAAALALGVAFPFVSDAIHALRTARGGAAGRA